MQAYVHNDKTLGKAARWLNKLERADAVSVYRLNDPQELKTCVQKFVIMTAQVRAMVESEWVEEWSIVEDPASLFAKASSMASGVSAADSTAIVALRDQLLAEINSKGWLPTETSQWYLPFRDDGRLRV